MESVFLTLLEISAASAVVILAVALLSSLINRNFTAKWKYWLWMVLAVRLLVPVSPSFEAAPARVEVSIPDAPITLPAAAAVPAPPGQMPTGPSVTIGISEPVSTAPAMTTVQLLMLLWLCGVVLFILWQLASYLRFCRQVRRWGMPIKEDSAAAVVLRQVEAEFGVGRKIPALVCKEVSSPMMTGFFRPLLILPQEEYSAQSLSYILRHELTHYQRRDIWYKALLLLANAVHWFNPAVWLMTREASRDLEISCDAAVMKNAGMEERRAYSEIILSCVHRELKVKTALSTHFYGGKKALKERFANILSTKKRRAGVIAFAAVLLCVALVGGLVACSASSPDDNEPDDGGQSNAGQPPEGPKTQLDVIIDSYYLNDHPEVQFDDIFPSYIFPSDFTLGRLVPQYFTSTGNQEELAALLEKLQSGERLSDNLELWNDQCDAMVYDNDGNIYGRVGISTVNYKIVSGSADGEATSRCDFQWPELVEAAIAQGLIDPDTAQIKSCLFGSFAQGILLYDDSREYFIATSREALHRVDFEVGTFYPIPELAEMLQNNLDALFDYPPMNLGAMPLPQSISLYEETQAGYQLWGLLIDDPEELALVASLLSTQYLTPSAPEDASWPDGGSPIEFEIKYEDHTVTGACNPQTINAPYRDGRYTQLRTFEDGVFYDYPRDVGNQLLAFLRSKGFDLGPWENPDTSQTEGRGYPTDRLTNLQVEVQEAFIAGLPASSYNHFHLYYEGDDIVLEIAVTDEAAVDAYLAAWTGERWDRLVKTPARVSQATLRRFAEEAQRLDFGPEVEVNDISAGPYLNSDESGMNVWIVMSDYNASREEVERWAELPQQLKDLAREMGIPEDMFHYRAPVYHVPGVNYDS